MTAVVSPVVPSSDQQVWDWPRAAYLHIPFCRQRCHYCDFATGLGTAALIETYVQKLSAEIKLIPVGGQSLNTIFLGGGTPSLLSVDQLGRILSTLHSRLAWDPDVEISLEANPGTVSREQLAGYRELGVNRVSLGVQAFQPELLKACGRLHGIEEVYQTIDDLQAVGLTQFNLDLIFGLPHQTLEDWQGSLSEIARIRPVHVALYDLTIEAGTRFGRLYQPGDHPLPTDTTTVQMYTMAAEQLEALGYDHYEISNFALPGYQCRHNRVYWENGSYYGLGMGAVGYVHRRRIHHARTLHEYFQTIDQGILPTAEVTSLWDQWLDTLMVGLRLREGLAWQPLQQQFPSKWIEAAKTGLDPFRAQGWVEWDESRVWLIPPEGWLFSNTILAALFETGEDPGQGSVRIY